VGRLAPQKGHRHLIDAAQRVVSKVPATKFVIIGEGELRPALERQIARHGLRDLVRLPGPREDARQLYAGFDVFALPSLWEAGPYALLEAQAAGCPAVATTAAACGEHVGNGDAGLCVPAGDADALADALIRILSDPSRRAAMGERAMARTRSRPSLREQADRIGELYARLARRRLAGEEAAERRLYETDPRAPCWWERAFKRIFDAVGAALALIVFAPLMAACALLVRLDSPGPALFRQHRVGYRERRFRMWKFRSMRADAESLRRELEDQREPSLPFFKMRRDPRVTRFGRLIRRLALDELPQLWNVVAGDMSLVGPRPLPARDLEEPGWLRRLPPEEAARHRRWRDLRATVRPGVTGLWQVSGCSELDSEGWLVHDLTYIHRRSPVLDAAILWRTVPVLFRGRRPNGREAGP
jgi:lipopolysaccharide/colanic/teichoic acid biosynthesis glycosyltransferase